ncbi:hypothetical protein ACJMK2_035645 [Sinanodonta woodiana]|uniref:Uncharacterized protein n=1 Tax=Sinanodonta woodiana TaxID=1069815 RepID=A0ABD3WZL1_SINWO
MGVQTQCGSCGRHGSSDWWIMWPTWEFRLVGHVADMGVQTQCGSCGRHRSSDAVWFIDHSELFRITRQHWRVYVPFSNKPIIQKHNLGEKQINTTLCGCPKYSLDQILTQLIVLEFGTRGASEKLKTF